MTPETVTTGQHLNDLPDGTVVLGRDEPGGPRAWQKHPQWGWQEPGMVIPASSSRSARRWSSSGDPTVTPTPAPDVSTTKTGGP